MLSNLISQSPEALEAQKNARRADRAARQDEITRLRQLYDDYTTESKISDLLPEDVNNIKTFLQKRIAKIQTSSSMTEEQLLALKEDKESLNYDNLMAAAPNRYIFYNKLKTNLDALDASMTAAGNNAISEKSQLQIGIKIINDGLKWFKKTQFETSDVYTTKLAEIKMDFEEKVKNANFNDPKIVQENTKAAADKCRQDFSFMNLINQAFSYVGGYLGIFLIFTSMILGASLAVNLNIYKNWAFRIIYAFYGAVFCAIVIPYVLFYRWAWLGKRPKFYSLIPLFPYHWNSRFAQILLGWISYRPDVDIELLREWEK